MIVQTVILSGREKEDVFYLKVIIEIDDWMKEQ